MDTEPDNFFYNFSGHSGAFVFGFDKSPILIPYKPIKVNFSSTSGFDITDEQGNRYNFNTKENVTSSLGSSLSGISSWYLTQMISADFSDTIKFLYTTDATALSDFTLNFSQAIGQDYSPYSLGTITHLQQMVETNPTRQFYPVRISSIQYRGGKVDFITKGGRLDDGNIALDSIIISNQDPSTNQYSRLRSFKLLTDYLYSTYTIPGNLVYTEASKHRLRLTGLQQNDRNNAAINSYQFGYNPGMLPAVHSFAQDSWGYFNGKTTNLSLLQAQNVVIYPSSGADPILDVVGGTQGADRSVSPNDMQAGVLTKITYPTNGFTMFAYENNALYGTTSVQTSFNSSAIGVNQETFTLPYTPTAGMLSSGGNIFRVQLRKGSDNPGAPLASIKIIRVSDGSIMYTITADPVNNIDKYVAVQLVADVAYQLVTAAAALSGTSPTSPTLPYAIITTSCQVPSAPGPINMGGLRISSIKNYNSDGTIASTETYKYGTSESGTGTLLTPYLTFQYNHALQYITSSSFCADQSPAFFPIASVITYTNNSVYPLGSLNGSPIGYPEVAVYKGDLSQNIGKSIFKYNLYTDSLYVPNGPYSNGFKPVPVTWKNGEPIWEGHYKNNGSGQYSLVKEISNSFDLIGRKNGVGTIFQYLFEPNGYSFNNPALVGSQIQTSIGCYTVTWTPQNFYWFDYPVSTGSRVLRQTLTSDYGPDGVSKITDTTKYYYGNLNHVFPTRIVTSTSKGDSLIKLMNYPQDMVNSGNDPTGVYGAMTSSNILAPVIEDISLKNAIPLTKTKTNYAKFNNLIFEPQTVELQIGTNPSEVKLNYLNYDSRGNILDYTYLNGAPASFDWGYNKVYPVVQMVNATNTSNTVASPVAINGTINLPPNNFGQQTVNFTSSYTGTITIAILGGSYLGTGGTVTVSGQFTLTGPSSQFGTMCISSTSGVCNYQSSYSFPNMPAGNYVLTFTAFNNNALSVVPIQYTYQGVQNTPIGVKEFFYEGFEENNASQVITGNAYTGVKYYNGNYLIPFTPPNSKNYTLQYWTYNGSWHFNQQPYSVNTTLTGPVDEVRVFPVDAQMTTYSYLPQVGVTEMTDLNAKKTSYEYDGFQRLKNIKDYQGNIIKNYQYNYANSCGTNCSVLPMQTFAGTNTLSYPVGVFNVNGKLLGNVTTQAQYITKWMADTADSHTGTIVSGVDSMHFKFTLNNGRTAPAFLTGCRYYQYDVSMTDLESIAFIEAGNGCYVDFGDGYSSFMGNYFLDTAHATNQGNFGIEYGLVRFSQNWMTNMISYVNLYQTPGTYPLTIYHNDDNRDPGLELSQTNSSVQVTNVRGNFPQNMEQYIPVWQYQPTSQIISNIANWNSITSIKKFTDGYHAVYSPDFMQYNVNLEKVDLTDTMSMKRLKSDWNTYFLNLDTLIFETGVAYGFENLTLLKNLRYFNYNNNRYNVTVTTQEIDNIINQINAGAGQFLINGFIYINAHTASRSSASDASVNALKTRGWYINVNGTVY